MSGSVTFRHETPHNKERVEIPEDVQLEHIEMQVEEGQAHLMWFETDGKSIAPTDL